MENPSDELADARQKRALEFQARQGQERQLFDALSATMDGQALGRLMNIRMANPGAFSQLATFILQAAQRGQLKTKLTDDQLKTLAARLSAAKPQSKISIHRK